jgi:hypothetical protein
MSSYVSAYDRNVAGLTSFRLELPLNSFFLFAFIIRISSAKLFSMCRVAPVVHVNYVIIIVWLCFKRTPASGVATAFIKFQPPPSKQLTHEISRMDDGTSSASATTTTTYSVALLSSRRQVEISVRCFPFCLRISDSDSRIFHFALSNSNSLTTT